MSTESGPVTGALQARPVFARRASNVMLLIAIVSLLAFLAMLGVARFDVPPALVGSAILVVVATGGTALVLSFALDRGAPWAPTAAVLVLWLVVIGGVVSALIALTQSSIRIPLDSIIAGWALSASDRPRTLSTAPGRGPIVAVVGLILLAEIAVTAAAVLSAAHAR